VRTSKVRLFRGLNVTLSSPATTRKIKSKAKFGHARSLGPPPLGEPGRGVDVQRDFGPIGVERLDFLLISAPFKRKENSPRAPSSSRIVLHQASVCTHCPRLYVRSHPVDFFPGPCLLSVFHIPSHWENQLFICRGFISA